MVSESAHSILYMRCKCQSQQFYVVMLYVDMICVRWRHAGKNGRIIVRGTDNAFLFRSSLVPNNLPAAPGSGLGDNLESIETSGTSCYFHTKQCVISDGKRLGDVLQCPPSYATSVGIDVKMHPTVTIYYNDRFSEQEKCIGNVDISYNTILFKKGVFTDSVMKAQGYGVLLLCHAIPDDPTHVAKSQILVNWRACRQVICQHLKVMAQRTAPAITTAADMQGHYIFSTKHSEITNSQNGSDAISSNGRQWDTSLYESLKQTVSSTFNLRM